MSHKDIIYDYFLIQRAQRIDAKRIVLEEVARVHVMQEGDEDSDSGIYGQDNYKCSFFFFFSYILELQYLRIFLTIDDDSEYIEETREVEIE